MTAGHRPFRIESMVETGFGDTLMGSPAVSVQLEQITQQLAELRTLVEAINSRDERIGQISEGGAFWQDVDAIQRSIQKTKLELATLHAKGLRGEQKSRVTDELDAVVSDTESATETILSSAEAINDATGVLMEQLTGEQQELANHIYEQVIRIFEACNFQDLTGQRIGKVVGTLKFIEERVTSMMEIWGGPDSLSSLAEVEVEEEEEKGDEALLNGPPLAGDVDVVSQDDVDSLFR